MKWADLWEQRTCTCGREFEAFAIWGDDDARCDACSRAAYRQRMDRINSARNFRVDSIGGACPTQSEGVTAGGRPFYFRARHGEWTLEFGEQGDPADYCKWTSREDIAEGDDPSGGGMEDAEVLAILDAYCGGDR